MEFFIIDSVTNKVITTRHREYEANMFARLYAKTYNTSIIIVCSVNGKFRLAHSDGMMAPWFTLNNVRSHIIIECPYVQAMVEYMYDNGYDSESIKSVLGTMFIKAY